jgi:L-aminopeptidase/D-esterase-like protein
MRVLKGGADFSSQGLAVGHTTDIAGATGVTVIRGIDAAFRAAAVIVGRATSTRQFDAMSPEHVVERIDAILLCGGSAFGLDSAAGVMQWMKERGRGFRVGELVVPIVPAAVIFDLGPLGQPDARPTAAMAYDACDRASPRDFGEGSVGAGTGATVGKAGGIQGAMKGGVGAATARGSDLVVSALAVVNAFGNVLDSSGKVLAGARDANNSFLDARAMMADGLVQSRFRASAAANTTLAVVACSAPLTRMQLRQLASAATAALFSRIVPAGTTVDGDVIFAVSPLQGHPADAMAAEALAVGALEEAIERAVLTASGSPDAPSHSQLLDAP